MIQIDDNWSIQTDPYNFILCRKNQRWFYPTIESLLNGLVNREILSRDCTTFKELSEAIAELRDLIHNAVADIAFKPSDTRFQAIKD